MDRNRRVPKGIRCQTVERSCKHAIIRIKLFKYWYDGDWIYLKFEINAKGRYLIKEAIQLTRQWQTTFDFGEAPYILPGMHEFNAAKLHATKAIETLRRKFGDQDEFFT